MGQNFKELKLIFVRDILGHQITLAKGLVFYYFI
jgi:hypothetical protein